VAYPENPLRKVSQTSEEVAIVRSGRQRKLHKDFLRYHDQAKLPILREALRNMGRTDKRHLVPFVRPGGTFAVFWPISYSSAKVINDAQRATRAAR